MIVLSKLCKTYKDKKRGTVEAVRDVTLTCHPGKVCGLLGPNGAGKTTTLRIVSTALKPTAGNGTVMGYDLERQAAEVRKNIGFLSSNTGLYGRLTPREILVYFGSLFGMSRTLIDSRIAELSDLFSMHEFLDRQCDKLSTGMRQKVNIARTVLHSPPVMIFDEPTSGLDVLTSRTIVRFISQCRDEGKTVIFSTHIMAEVDRLCDSVAIIHNGTLHFSGTVDEIRAAHGDDLSEAFVKIIKEATS